MPAAADRYYTREMVLALPDDGNRYELVHGELLVSPSPVPRHQVILGRLYAWLFHYLELEPVGRVLHSPADITWGRDDDVLVQPDLFIVGRDEMLQKTWHGMSHFLLFAEVLSPSTSRYDRFTKRYLYQERGVPLYWVLDPVGEAAEVWTPASREPAVERERLTWHPAGAEKPFSIELTELFQE